MNKKKCQYCENGYLEIADSKCFISSIDCDIKVKAIIYVCPNCGHIELFAPENVVEDYRNVDDD